MTDTVRALSLFIDLLLYLACWCMVLLRAASAAAADRVCERRANESRAAVGVLCKKASRVHTAISILFSAWYNKARSEIVTITEGTRKNLHSSAGPSVVSI